MVTFRRLLPLFFACIFSISLFAQKSVADQVLAQEQKRFDAMISADTLHLRDMLTADMVYVHSNSLQENKAEHLRAIGSRKLVYQKLQREQASVKLYGKTALVNGRVNAAGILNGNPFDIKLVYIAVYRKMHKTWQLSHWQSTRIP